MLRYDGAVAHAETLREVAFALADPTILMVVVHSDTPLELKGCLNGHGKTISFEPPATD